MNILNGIKIVALFLLITSCVKKSKEKSLTELASETIPVKVIPVKSLIRDATVNATGLITTENEANYSFKIGGVVERILVTEGQSFKKGQLLATLKHTEIGAQFSQAQMGYEKAKRDYVRANNLYRDSVATLEQLQNAKTGLGVAKAGVDAAAFNKKYANIYANSDGFVTGKMANEGEVISAGSPVLAISELPLNSNWIVRLGITDKQWAFVSIGQKAKISIDAFPGESFQGIVLRKSQSSDKSNGSFQVEIKITNSGNRLAAGMFATAYIQTRSKAGFPVIPFEALIEADGNVAMVFVPVNGKVKRVPIIIEGFNKDEVIIKSGLEKYDEIITSNSAFLNESSTIKIIR